MDVELQILKHLPRDAQPTVALVGDYCGEYQDLFQDVRNYECFKYLHVGIISPIPRKSLPEIAKVVSINSAQSLHHFIANANSDWSVEDVSIRRLNKIKGWLTDKSFCPHPPNPSPQKGYCVYTSWLTSPPTPFCLGEGLLI
jgi:hypothetical protein